MCTYVLCAQHLDTHSHKTQYQLPLVEEEGESLLFLVSLLVGGVMHVCVNSYRGMLPPQRVDLYHHQACSRRAEGWWSSSAAGSACYRRKDGLFISGYRSKGIGLGFLPQCCYRILKSGRTLRYTHTVQL
jgi:hypothetical protein